MHGETMKFVNRRQSVPTFIRGTGNDNL